MSSSSDTISEEKLAVSTTGGQKPTEATPPEGIPCNPAATEKMTVSTTNGHPQTATLTQSHQTTPNSSGPLLYPIKETCEGCGKEFHHKPIDPNPLIWKCTCGKEFYAQDIQGDSKCQENAMLQHLPLIDLKDPYTVRMRTRRRLIRCGGWMLLALLFPVNALCAGVYITGGPTVQLLVLCLVDLVVTCISAVLITYREEGGVPSWLGRGPCRA